MESTDFSSRAKVPPLPWDDACLKFYERKRRVTTASKDQVRRPIYASSVGRWKHYGKHLGPMVAALAGD